MLTDFLFCSSPNMLRLRNLSVHIHDAYYHHSCISTQMPSLCCRPDGALLSSAHHRLVPACSRSLTDLGSLRVTHFLSLQHAVCLLQTTVSCYLSFWKCSDLYLIVILESPIEAMRMSILMSILNNVRHVYSHVVSDLICVRSWRNVGVVSYTNCKLLWFSCQPAYYNFSFSYGF